MTKKKVVITGVSGFIGSSLAEYLAKEYTIIGIDRKPWKGFNELYNKYKDVTFFQQDINDKLSDIDDIDYVIHLAALPGVRNSHNKFEQVCRDNILGTQNILKKCMENWKPRRILLASSSSVYGDLGRDGHALEEKEGVNPRSPYAMSKVANEELMRVYKNSGMLKSDIACMRFFTVYGPHQRNELAIRAFTDWILRDQPIRLNGTGLQKRDFTNINDICRGIERLMKYNIDDNITVQLPEDIYNIGSNNSISITEIIHKICEITGKDVTIKYYPRDKYDVDCTKASIDRMNYLGWHPKVKFEDGLKEQIEWQIKQYKEERDQLGEV